MCVSKGSRVKCAFETEPFKEFVKRLKAASPRDGQDESHKGKEMAERGDGDSAAKMLGGRRRRRVGGGGSAGKDGD